MGMPSERPVGLERSEIQTREHGSMHTGPWRREESLGDHGHRRGKCGRVVGTMAVLRSHGGRNAAMQMFHKRRQQKGRAPNHETTL